MVVKHTVKIPADTPLSTPYWLASPPQPGGFAIADQQLVGLPEDPPQFPVDFVLDAGGRTVVLSRPIAFKWTDPVAGERYRPLEITPRVSVRPDTQVLMFPDKQHQPRALTVRLTAGAPAVKGTLHFAAPAGWQIEPASQPFAIEAKGQEVELAFHVRHTAKPGEGPAGPALLQIYAELTGQRRRERRESDAIRARRGAHRARAHPDPDLARRRRGAAGAAGARDRRHAHRLFPRPGRRGPREPAARRLRRDRCSTRARCARAARRWRASTRW